MKTSRHAGRVWKSTINVSLQIMTPKLLPMLSSSILPFVSLLPSLHIQQIFKIIIVPSSARPSDYHFLLLLFLLLTQAVQNLLELILCNLLP